MILPRLATCIAAASYFHEGMHASPHARASNRLRGSREVSHVRLKQLAGNEGWQAGAPKGRCDMKGRDVCRLHPAAVLRAHRHCIRHRHHQLPAIPGHLPTPAYHLAYACQKRATPPLWLRWTESGQGCRSAQQSLQLLCGALARAMPYLVIHPGLDGPAAAWTSH